MKMPGNGGGSEGTGVCRFVALDSASSPSPGTPGEGRGEGLLFLPEQKDPHPNPLPEYRERGQERNRIGMSNPPSFSSAHPCPPPEYRERGQERNGIGMSNTLSFSCLVVPQYRLSLRTFTSTLGRSPRRQNLNCSNTSSAPSGLNQAELNSGLRRQREFCYY